QLSIGGSPRAPLSIGDLRAALRRYLGNNARHLGDLDKAEAYPPDDAHKSGRSRWKNQRLPISPRTLRLTCRWPRSKSLSNIPSCGLPSNNWVPRSTKRVRWMDEPSGWSILRWRSGPTRAAPCIRTRVEGLTKVWRQPNSSTSH